MKVDANRMQPPITKQTKSNAPLVVRQPEPKDSPKQVKEPATDAAESAQQKNRAQGAMKLLQEGHFKGVAALRLNINFFDQLSELEQKTLQGTVQEGTAELPLAIEEQITGLSTSGLIEEETLPQLADLTKTFISQIHSSTAGEKVDPQQLTMNLEQHYGNYRTALQDLLLAPEPGILPEAEAGQVAATDEIPPTADPSAETNPTVIIPQETELDTGPINASPLLMVEENENQVQLATSLEALDSTFHSQLSSIEERLQDVSLPSVPEQADNQGVAFQKFLAIYQEMQGITEVDSEQIATEGS